MESARAPGRERSQGGDVPVASFISPDGENEVEHLRVLRKPPVVKSDLGDFLASRFPLPSRERQRGPGKKAVGKGKRTSGRFPRFISSTI